MSQEAAASKGYKNPEIEEDAKKYGYKAANLINLQGMIEEFNASSEVTELRKLYEPVTVKVPSFIPIDKDLIEQHLTDHAIEWKELFANFQTKFKEQKEQDTLNPESKEALEELQEVITACFKDHPLPPKVIEEFLRNNLGPGSLLMVRSTGIHEDKADMANPGGNESVPCKSTPEAISAALGQVVASYVSFKSLSQRLLAGDKFITEFPVMPGLIQEMVGEDIGNSQEVYSGVVYSNDGSTRLQAAPGHGEYVVNSKGKVDNYYVSNQGIVYSEIAPKDFRLKPNVNSKSSSQAEVSLERVSNNRIQKYSPSLEPNIAIYLHHLSNYIEKQYGCRMDIEFVYSPANESTAQPATINIVQARAIPEGSRKGLVPSALAPAFVASNRAQLTSIDGLQVITPEINRAAVITGRK